MKPCIRLLVLLLLLPAACKNRPPGPAPASTTAPAPRKTAPSERGGGDASLSALRVSLIKRAASDKAAAQNLGSFGDALKRQKRELTMGRFAERIPKAAPDQPTILAALTEAAGDDLVVSAVSLGKPKPLSKAVPAEHSGSGPFEYTEEQLVETWIVRVTFATEGGLDDLTVRKFVKRLPNKVGRMFEFKTLKRLPGDRASLEGVTFRERTLKPPKHLPKELPELPANHPRVAELQQLVDQIMALAPRVEATLAIASVAHLLGARFAILKQLAERIERSALTIR